MNLLLICEIACGLPTPEFGAVLAAHIDEKKHPDVRAASLTAWNLLACGLKQLGFVRLPEVVFEAGGKPRFTNANLCFSLSHSGNLAAALLSPAPCAVDLEQLRPAMEARLGGRCLSDAERAANCGFFECWTKKECIGKLSGKGIPAHPAQLDSLDPAYADRFFIREIQEDGAARYVLAALCMDGIAPIFQKALPEELF